MPSDRTAKIRLKLWHVPVFCILAIALFYITRLQNLFDSYSRLIINRKPHDMALIAKSLRLIEEAGGTEKIESSIRQLGEDSQRNTAILLLKEQRKYPNLIIQPRNRIEQGVIRKAISRWNEEPFGGKLYQRGVSFCSGGFLCLGGTYHLIATRQSVLEGSYELLLVTNLDKSIEPEYLESTIALTALLAAMAGAIIPGLLSLTISIRRTTESVRRDGISPSWYWTQEVIELFETIKAYKIGSELYKVQIDQSTSGQMIVRSKGTEEALIYSPNKAIAKISGYTQAELEGKPLNLIVPEEFHKFHTGSGAYDSKRKRRVGMAAYVMGCPFHGEQASSIFERDRTVDLKHKDGSIRKIILGVHYLGKNESGEDEWAGAMTDVTALVDAIAKAESLAKDTQNITHIFAHDLKAGEVASAKAGEYITETAKDLIEYFRQVGTLDKSIERSLGFIVKYSSRITASCQNNFALIDQRNKLHDLKERITPEPHKITDIFEGVDVSFNRTDGKLIFVDECSPETTVQVDIALFLSALKNLVKNGFAYNDSIEKIIEIKVVQKNGKIVLSVADNGVGFPAEYILTWGQIQGQAARLDLNSEGSGTGLYSVRRIIEAHNGATIELESEQGVGSCFTITLGG